MKPILFSIFLLSFSLISTSQSLVNKVTASGGDYSESTSFKISYTIGDLIVEEIGTQNTSFTTGFQQHWDISVGINDITKELVINAYPNPFSDILKINFGMIEYSDLKVEVLSLSGSLVMTREFKGPFTGRTEELDLSMVERGMFLLRISSESGRASKIIRLVKQ